MNSASQRITPMLRTLLISIVCTLAIAASLILIVERISGRGGPDAKAIALLEARLQQIELILTQGPPQAQADSADEGSTASNTSPAPLKIPSLSPDRLGEINTLCGEIQGMLLDLEKDQRRDLNRVYTQLLGRLDEIMARGGAGGAGGAPKEIDPATKRAVRAKLGEMGVKIYEEEGMVELIGRIGSPDHALEFIACAPGGKLHEALLVLDVIPSALKIGLEDIGMTEVEVDAAGKWRENPTGVYIYVLYKEWKKPRRIETMIENRRTGDTMTLTPFVFTASFMETDQRTWERYYAADAYKHVIALTTNFAEVSVLACPLQEADNQDIWWPLAEFNPPAQAEVKVFLRKEAKPEWDKLR